MFECCVQSGCAQALDIGHLIDRRAWYSIAKYRDARPRVCLDFVGSARRDQCSAGAANDGKARPTRTGWKARQPLRQDELSAQFGLSRIPVREALRQLEGEGLVTVIPHRGAVVSELSLGELQEICEIRIALETTALRLAIPHLDEDSLAHAEAILRATDATTDLLEHWSRNNWLFHSTLYTPAKR